MPITPIFEKKNVLVIGGAGFIGSHLCDSLIKTNKVICLDNFISGSEINIDHLLRFPDFEFIKHDITEPINLEKFPELEKFNVRFQGVQEIYNLACPTSPRDFEKYRIETIFTNSYGTRNALDLAVKYKAKFLHFSSSVVYGGRIKENFFYKEDYIGVVDPLSPRSCYDEGKRFAESLVANYRSVYNIDAKIARIFRTYGSRMKLGEGHMMPDFIINALDNKDLVIYGDETFSSSFCYVSDIVDGVIRLMKTSPEVYLINLGSPRVYKIVDVAKEIIKMTSSQSKIVFHAPLLFMTPLGLPDITQAREKLGWIPVVTLKSGLEKFIDYAKAHKEIKGFV